MGKTDEINACCNELSALFLGLDKSVIRNMLCEKLKVYNANNMNRKEALKTAKKELSDLFRIQFPLAGPNEAPSNEYKSALNILNIDEGTEEEKIFYKCFVYASQDPNLAIENYLKLCSNNESSGTKYSLKDNMLICELIGDEIFFPRVNSDLTEEKKSNSTTRNCVVVVVNDLFPSCLRDINCRNFSDIGNLLLEQYNRLVQTRRNESLQQQLFSIGCRYAVCLLGMQGIIVDWIEGKFSVVQFPENSLIVNGRTYTHTIDLHYFLRREAILLMDALLCYGQSQCSPITITLIVGKGNRSMNQQPVLGPNISQYLRSKEQQIDDSSNGVIHWTIKPITNNPPTTKTKTKRN